MALSKPNIKLIAFLLLFISTPVLAGDWPQFRGPTGQGHSGERGLPLTWSETKNVRWKVAIPGKGWSSPVIQGDRIWLTTATEEGKALRAISVDRNTGAILLNVEVFRLRPLGKINSKNSYASPTPLLEGDRVYVHFGAHGTACITQSGEIVWKTRLEYDNGQHGPGGSPVLYENLLIVSCDGQDVQFVVALDKLTGKVRWKKSRAGQHAYTTPLVVPLAAGDQVISPGAFRAIAYDPRTGKELWQVKYGDGFSNVPRPVYGHGLVFICTGFQQPSLLAVRLDGRGDVTKSHTAWTLNRGVPLTPSPLLVDGELYLISDNGIASCVDAKTGNQHWQVRLGGNHSASPIYADGRIYFLSEEGESVVIAPGKQFKALAQNQLDGETLASMAVSNGSIFIRSLTHLYRLSLRDAHDQDPPIDRKNGEVKSVQGIQTSTFDTARGKIRVYLPDEMMAGDKISGTVVAEPKGGTVAERRGNADALNGYVIEIEGARASPGKGIEFVIPTGSTVDWQLNLVLKDPAGNAIANTHPVVVRPPQMGDAKTGSTLRYPTGFRLPDIGQTSRPIQIYGPFDGSFENTTVKVGGVDVVTIAESPRKVVFEGPTSVTGPVEIILKERTVETKGQYRNVGVLLSATTTTLRKGERATLTIQVVGLAGIRQSVSLQLETTGVVSMEGGNVRQVQIRPMDVQSDGRFTQTVALTAQKAGAFNVTATVK